jgi:hypothetical protein
LSVYGIRIVMRGKRSAVEEPNRACFVLTPCPQQLFDRGCGAPKIRLGSYRRK